MKPFILILIAAALPAAELPVVTAVAAGAGAPLEPASAVWNAAPPVSLALNRTPPLYATDAPAALEILAVEIRLLRASGKTFVRLSWKDASRDDAVLPAAKNTWQTETPLARSPATDRFFDGCAVMLPASPVTNELYPSLQMGDANHPVTIYYFDVVRGAAVMEASGRATTHRTGKSFPARAAYGKQGWQVSLELPEVLPGTPLSVAVWNGRQQDRDGRKYFSLWHATR